MNKINELIEELSQQQLKSDTKKLHRNMVRGIKLKRTPTDALAPTIPGPCALYTDSSIRTLTNNAADMTEVMSTFLHSLGGDTHFKPRDEVLQEFLKHTPHDPSLSNATIPPIQWKDLNAKLNSAKLYKAGGRDKCNLHLFSLAPNHILEIPFHACNYFLDKPMPAEWTEAEIFLLFKKNDADNPTNYRPISLLGVVYKLIASHITTYLASISLTHKLINPA